MKIANDKFNWTVEPMDTGTATAALLKSKGFDGVCYSATRKAKRGNRTFAALVYKNSYTGEYVLALKL